jgi:hypothetical protein
MALSRNARTRGQKVINIDHHPLINDLGVVEEEHYALTLHTTKPPRAYKIRWAMRHV